MPKIELNAEDLEVVDGVNDLLLKYLQYMEAGRLREGKLNNNNKKLIKLFFQVFDLP